MTTAPGAIPPAPPAPPVATWRVQLTPRFGFAAARDALGYLADLGVSHLYCSPIFETRPGSEHGYDAVDPTRIRAELGGEAEFRALAAEARARGMGVIVDIVPNHMAADARNPMWWSMLERGRESPFATFFDVDWEAGGGRLVLPVLGDPLDSVLERGELRIERDGPPSPTTIGGSRSPAARSRSAPTPRRCGRCSSGSTTGSSTGGASSFSTIAGSSTSPTSRRCGPRARRFSITRTGFSCNSWPTAW